MATIQIADNDARVQYTQAINGLDNDPSPAATELVIDFPFFILDDINVIKTTAAGVDTVLSRGTGTGTFTVTGTSVDDGFSGGNVKLHDTDATSTTKYTVFRKITIQRTADFPTSGPFNISALNTDLDKLTAIAQENKNRTERTLILPDSDSTVSLVLPNVDSRKGKTLAFNASSGAVEAGPSISDVQTVSGASADIQTLAHIEDGTDATDAIQTVAGISSNVTSVANISSNVSTVAGISSNVTAVAGDATDIGTVSTNIANVNTVAGISSNVTTVATNNSNVTAVAGNATNINTVAGISSDVNSVAGISSDVTTVAADGTDIGTVAGISSNVTTVAGISGNVTTVAGVSANVTTVAGISSDVTTVAGDSADIQAVAADASDIGTVSTNIANVNTVAGSIANVNTTASNITGVNSFAERYRVGSSDPTTSLNEGDLFFNTTSNEYKFYDGSAWQAVNVSGLANVAEDTTPQLGGNLDLNSNDITGTGNINITGNVGIGTTSPDGSTHIFNSSAGTVTAPTDANELVLESAANVGMSFLTANSSIARIKFGDPDATNSGVIAYNHSDDSLTFNASGSARLRVDSGGIDITGGFTATDGSTITTADNSTQLTLKSTDDDNNEGPRLDFIRDSASPADNDQIGIMRFLADNDAGTQTTFAEISGTLRDVSDGTLGSELRFAVTRNNTLKEVMSVSHTDFILNESGEDINVRIESSANANMFKLDGGINKIGIGKAPTQGLLDVNGAVFSTGLTVDTTTLHVDGSSNNVGIGTAAPADKLHIYKGASGKSSFSSNTAILIEDNVAAAIQFATPNTANQQILFSDPEDNTAGKIQYQHSTNLMTFDTDGDESMRITSGHTVVGRSEGGTANRVSFTQGSAKSYVTFDMDLNNSILDDYNVSSLTDNATGINTVNIDNNMNNVNYAITFGFEDNASNVNVLKIQENAIPTTGAYTVKGGAFQNGSTNTNFDINRAYCVVHGRQA